MRNIIIALATMSIASTCAARDTPIANGRLVNALNANGNAITNVATPVASGDAANKAYVDLIGGVSPSVVTNVAGRVTSNVVTKAYVEGLGISTGIDTNAVRDIVASASVTNAGAVAAAAAMTNAALTEVSTTFLKLTGGTVSDYIYFNKPSSVQLLSQYSPPSNFEGTSMYDFSSWSIIHFYDGYMFCDANGESVAAISSDFKITNGAWGKVRFGGTLIDVLINDQEVVAHSIPAVIGRLALTNDIPSKIAWSAVTNTPTTLAGYGLSEDAYTKTEAGQTFASKATEATVSEWETYWRGDRVRLSVTNYYGNTSGESPRLRIEEFDHSTTNGTVVSNFYHVVWDEIDRQTNYMAKTDAKVNNISNAVMDAAWRQTNLQLVNKAPRAWQSVTSAGEDAPPNTVWHTAPQSVFAGGTEYAHVAVGEGTICVLTDKGAPVYTDGAEGQFRFQDQSGQNYFGFDVRSSYKIGCRTDGISVNSQQHIVSLTYDLTSATNPSILHSTNLVDWADAVVEWEQNPPEGTKVCYINCGNDPKGFYQAEIRYAGGSKFLTNMQADLMGGIAASNQTLNVIQSVEPYIISNQVMWRVKQ